MIRFGIIGGGWRTEFYLRIAKALPERFQVSAILLRDEQKAKQLEHRWGVKTFVDLEVFLNQTEYDFVVVSVSWPAAPVFIKQLADRQVPVLSETPPAPDLTGLLELHELSEKGAKVQIAEQYQYQPLHAARIQVARSGKLGSISQVELSVCHGYHAVSLMRRFMGIAYENVTISARIHRSRIVAGPNYNGCLPEEEQLTNSEQTLALLDFDGIMGIYNFTFDQYFSWIRSLRLLVRGERGEIADSRVRYLHDYRTPADFELLRHNAGENGNLEGYYLKGITAGEQWLYRNPFAPGRLTDDEIAIAACLTNMSEYVKGGPSFYSLAEASQDHYLSLLIDEAAASGSAVRSQTQPWAGK